MIVAWGLKKKYLDLLLSNRRYIISTVDININKKIETPIKIVILCMKKDNL